MPFPQSERALRRLVADLARAPAEDIEAVLADLEPVHRARVQALIVDYLGGSPKPTAQPAALRGRDYSKVAGLSPWLAERLGAAEPARRSGLLHRKAAAEAPSAAFAMTPAAQQALRQCAAAVPMRETRRGLFARFRKRTTAPADLVFRRTAP
jgi:hypothetical protein